VQLATKFGLISDNIINERADPEWIRMPCEGSSKMLDVNFIDLYYLHHIDSKVPIEINVHFQPSPLSPHDAFWKRVLL
jgi:aryl-alcohol dehydrogenase-like predicted oxidoreductase